MIISQALPSRDQEVVVVLVFDFIRLDIKAQFTIFGVNGSWEWWVTGKKGHFVSGYL